jgi:hypothetical protein
LANETRVWNRSKHIALQHRGKIGKGEMGEVLRAKDQKLGWDVAINATATGRSPTIKFQ